MADRLSLILFSGTADKLLPAAVLASGAVAVGMEVQIFATFWGLLALKRGATATLPPDVDPEAAQAIDRALQAGKVPPFVEMLRQAKELGDVHVHACGMSMDLFGLKETDLEDVVDDVTGVSAFLALAKEGEVTLFL
jgi:peroxiredoxin family protein